ncbi:MAG: hypothetical protein ABH814_02595 [bacterium]
MRDNFLLKLYKIPQTVFSLSELCLFFPTTPYNNLKRRLNYYVLSGSLLHLRKAIYAKEGFNPLEIPGKIYTPSYISLETVLAFEGVIFQADSTISCVSYLSRRISVADTPIVYRQIKSSVLTNPQGVETKNGYSTATKERAFLDALFLFRNYYFDNLNGLNWSKVLNLQKIYKNRELEKRVSDYWRMLKKDYA